MTRARDASRLTSLRPILASWKQPNSDFPLDVGCLVSIRQHVIPAMRIDNEQTADSLGCEGIDDVVDDAIQRDRGDTQVPAKVECSVSIRTRAREAEKRCAEA